MPFIQQANIACGFHASDPHHMRKTIQAAVKHGVTIGAHPGYPDLLGFGRRAMDLTGQPLIDTLQYQIGALQALCQAQGTQLCYIKPHGALYHAMMQEESIFITILQAVATLDNSLAVMVFANPSQSDYQAIADRYQVPLWFEAFADRRYDEDGSLIARNQPTALLTDVDQIVEQAQQLICSASVTTTSGRRLEVQATSLCLHGDNPSAPQAAKLIRALMPA